MNYVFSAEKLALLKSKLVYDPLIGEFTRKDGKGRTRRRTTADNRYRQLNVDGVIYYAHIVAYWMMMDEAIPSDKIIDHKDRNRWNCRWSNLRLVTPSGNLLNAQIRINNHTGVRGVSITSSGTWDSRITVDRKVILLGRHKSFEDAVEARRRAEIRLFGKTLPEIHEDLYKEGTL